MNRSRQFIGLALAFLQVANAITPDGSPPIKNLNKAIGTFLWFYLE